LAFRGLERYCPKHPYQADLVDQGYIQTTVGKNLGAINAENLKAAHQELESGRSIGKIVLQGF